jgi:hypothetical protein
MTHKEVEPTDLVATDDRTYLPAEMIPMPPQIPQEMELAAEPVAHLPHDPPNLRSGL